MPGDIHSRKPESFQITYPISGVAQIEQCNLLMTEITTWRCLQALLHYFLQEPTIRAIILVLDTHGEKPLETGLLSSIATVTQGTHGQNIASLNEIDNFLSCLSARKKPIICILHGKFQGSSLLIPSACDIRICTADTRFCTWNDHDNPCHEALESLRDTVHNKGLLRECAIIGKEFDASDANQMGFISKVKKSKVEAVTEGKKIAEIVTNRPPAAVERLVQNATSQPFLYDYTEEQAQMDISQALGVGSMRWAKSML